MSSKNNYSSLLKQVYEWVKESAWIDADLDQLNRTFRKLLSSWSFDESFGFMEQDPSRNPGLVWRRNLDVKISEDCGMTIMQVYKRVLLKLLGEEKQDFLEGFIDEEHLTPENLVHLGWINIAMIKAIGWKNLSNRFMINDTIGYIGESLTIEQIETIWENLGDQYTMKSNKIKAISKWGIDKIQAFWSENFTDPRCDSKKIHAIRNLSDELIKLIWWDNLINMEITLIDLIGNSESSDLIKLMGWVNLASEYMDADKMQACLDAIDFVEVLGWDNVASEYMAIDKLKAIFEDLTVCLVRAIGGENLASENMTVEKILKMSDKMISFDDIERVWWEGLVNMSLLEMDMWFTDPTDGIL